MQALIDIISELHSRPARQRPTQSQTSALIDVLANHTADELVQLKQVDLAFLVSKGLGFSVVDRIEGGTVKSRDAKKDALIQSIQLATVERRALLQLNDELSRADVESLSIKQPSLSGGTKEFEVFMHDTLERIARYISDLYDRETGEYSQHTTELDRIAASVTGFLTHPRNGQPWSPSSVVKTRGNIKKAMNEFISTALPASTPQAKREMWDEVSRLVMVLVVEMTRTFDIERKQFESVSMTRRATNIPTGVVLDAMLQHAADVLQTVDVRDTTQWREVMLALCLATGRRSVEVFCTGTFEAVETEDSITLCDVIYPVPATHLLRFGGHVKAAGSSAAYYAANPSYLIPTLLPASLVLRGFKLLMKKRAESFGGTVATDNQREILRFNRSFSGELTKPAQRWAAAFLPNVSEYIMGSKSRTFTPHRLRSLYAHCCNQWLNESGAVQTVRFIADVLGDSRGSDNKAVGEHYEIGFRLDPNSLTHI